MLEDKSILKVAQNMKYDWLIFAQRGIEYLYVIGPNKETVYPDYVPAAQKRVGPTRWASVPRTPSL